VLHDSACWCSKRGVIDEERHERVTASRKVIRVNKQHSNGTATIQSLENENKRSNLRSEIESGQSRSKRQECQVNLYDALAVRARILEAQPACSACHTLFTLSTTNSRDYHTTCQIVNLGPISRVQLHNSNHKLDITTRRSTR
jgi:hypothetical protein